MRRDASTGCRLNFFKKGKNLRIIERARPWALALPPIAQPMLSRFADYALGVPTTAAGLKKWFCLEFGERTVPATGSNILMAVEKAFPASRGGYAARTHVLAKGLASHGWRVTVVARTGGVSREVFHTESVDGVEYRLYQPKSSSWKSCAKAWEGQVGRAISELRPQVIWAASSALWTAMPALRASTATGIPFVYDIRGFSEITRSLTDSRYRRSAGFRAKRLAEKYVIQNADICCAIDPGIARLAPSVPRDVVVVPNSALGVDPRYVRAATFESNVLRGQNRVRLVYAGSLHVYEGLESLLQAIYLLRLRGIDVELDLVGGHVFGVSTSHVALNRLRRSAKRYFIDDLVTFHGSLPPREAEQVIDQADMFVVPRISNDITQSVPPIKTFTALSLGVPIVTSDVAPLKAIVENSKAGFTFRAGNAEDLSRVLERATEDRKGLAVMGKRGQEFVLRVQTPHAVVAPLVDALTRRGIAP